VLDNEHIDSMFHLGPRTFDELSGEVVQNTAFVISKNHQKDNRGTYFRLVDGKNCGDKEQMFLFYSEQGAKIYYPNIPQSNFEKIPGCPIGYWVSEGMVNTFSFSQIGDMTTVRVGMSTSDSKRFLRLWFESDINKIGFGFTNSIEAMDSHKKWFPINKGGSFRKWYGNKEYVVNYQNDGDELKHWLVNNPNDPSTTSWSRYIRSPKYYFKPSLTWSKVSSSDIFSIRYSEAGSIFSDASNGIFMEKQDCLLYMLGILNSKLASNYIKVLSPTLNTTSGDICKVPYIEKSNSHLIDLINGTIIISKQDWDAHETSWDFQCNELVAIMHGSGALASPSQSQSQSPSQSLPSLDNAGLKPSLQPSLLASFLDRNAAVDVKKGHLPHWTQDGKLIFITFRLCDSLPQTTLNEYKAQKATWIKSHPEPWDKSTATEYARKFSDIMDTYLDNGYGECVLKNIDACKIVCDTIRKNAENKYDIISYVVMPNHVHILIRVINDTKLSEITQHWKGESAFRINKLLNRKSSLWMPESFDRIIRDETHLEYVLNYIKKNNDEGGIAYYDVHGGEALASLSNDTHVVDSAGLKPRLQPRLLEDIVKEYKQKWEDKFMRLHANEEELNRQFIEIYGLQDELTPDVPLSEITILQQGEISIEENNDNKESNE
jgi:REP element-mobilizing transposase RayT